MGEKSGRSLSLALWFAAALVFVRFSMLNELITHLTGLNVYLLYLFGFPAILAAIAKGRARETMSTRPVVWWLSFGFWLAAAVPFSIWKGGSAHIVWTYFRSDLTMMFVIGAVARTWRDCRALMLVIAAAAMVTLVSSKFFAQAAVTGRMDLEFGTVANANDFAGHLLFVLPFVLWVVVSSRSRMLRLAALLGVCYGMYLLLATGSRGALVGLAADLLFITFKGSLRHRLVLCLLAPVVLVAAFIVLPNVVSKRLTSFSSSAEASREALESSQAREHLLLDSVWCALENPIVGIGPGQFTTYEGTKSVRGSGTFWHGAHNSYVAAASEAGIPALFFYFAAIWSSWRLLKRILRRSSSEPQMSEQKNAVFCLMTAMLGFCTAIFFLNFTYMFYLPAMSGLAIALARGTDLDANGSEEVWKNAAVALHPAWNGPSVA